MIHTQRERTRFQPLETNALIRSKHEPLPLVVIVLSAKLSIGCHSAARHCCRKLQPHFVSLSGKISF